jgi:sugar/nucleoside kinase (ribokinase family)
MSGHVLSVGDLVIDMIMPVSLPLLPAQHQNVDFLKIEPGGASNFMIAARHMGLRISSVGALGDDMFGTELLRILNDVGVETQQVYVEPDTRSTTVMVLTDQNTGQHVFIGHYGNGNEAPYTEAIDTLVASVDAVLIQGYTYYERRVVTMAMQTVTRAQELGVPVYLDIGPMMAQLTAERAQWAVSHANVVFLTEDEVPLAADGRTGQKAYQHLFGLGVEQIVLKQGAHGCSIITPSGSHHVPGFRVSVVDTVGAGDSFDAAYITGNLAGMDAHHSALLANAMGAACVQKVGAGRNVPTCAEVQAVLNANAVDLDFHC